jgi:hypothetical protein
MTIDEETMTTDAHATKGAQRMPRRLGIPMTAHAVFLGMALVRSAAAQSPARTSQPRALGPLNALSAEEQSRLALSTAPPEVSSRASLYILTQKGYVQARTGTNGFSCLVEREFLETVEPVCYDAEGTATTLLARLYREELRAQGFSEDEVKGQIAAAYPGGRLRAPRKPGIVYMLARENWAWNPFARQFGKGPPHFMLYAPFATQEDLGGFSGPHMPVVLWPGHPDAFIIVMAQDSSRH